MKKFRWTVALLVVLAMVLCTPLTAFAATWDAETSDDVFKAFNEDTDAEVIINMKNDIVMDTGLQANEDQKYTINGDGNTISNLYLYGLGEVEVNADITGTDNLAALEAGEEVTVTVNGDVTGGDDNGGSSYNGGNGVSAWGQSTVTVNGNVTGGDSFVDGNGAGTGVEARDESTVTVNGNVTGGSGELDDAHMLVEDSYADGGAGVSANQSASVTVNGDVAGGDGMGNFAYGGAGIEASSAGDIVVTGNVTGGDSIGNEDALGDYTQRGGHGILAAYGSDVQVDGDVTAGDAVGNGTVGGVGVIVSNIAGYGGTDNEPGEVLVKGTVAGGSGEEDGMAVLYEGNAADDEAFKELAEEVIEKMHEDGFDPDDLSSEEKMTYYMIIEMIGRGLSEEEIAAYIEAYLEENGLTEEEFWNSAAHIIALERIVYIEEAEKLNFDDPYNKVTVWALDGEVGTYDDNYDLVASEEKLAEVNFYVKVIQPKGGTITVDKESGKVGEKITVSVKVDEGYTLKGVSTSVGELKAAEGGTYTFEVPAGGEIVVSAVIEAATSTPNTGDGFEMGLMGALVCVSLLGMTAMLTLRKKFN